KQVLKVSSQSMTCLGLCGGGSSTRLDGAEPRPHTGDTRRLNHSRNVSRANAGIFLCLGIPAILFAISRNKGACVAKFTSPGATERTRAQTSIFPNAYALRGRARPS